MKDKKKQSKFNRKSILAFVISGAAGFVIAFVVITIGKQKIPESSSFGSQMLPALILLISMYFGIILNTIIHEAGHLICGLLSGYKFVSFSVARIMVVRENGKLKRKKYGIAGVGGQCLMSPPEPVNQSYPYLLYNLGGSLMNFIAAGIFIVLFVLLRDIVYYSEAIFLPIAAASVFLGLSNILPVKIGGISTDGHNVLSLQKSEQTRRAFWILLTISARMMLAKRLRDLPDEWFEFTETYNFNDTISANVAVFKLSRLIELRNFEEAKALAEKILREGTKVAEVLKNETRCELLFLHIIGEASEQQQDAIHRLYTPELKQYIKASKTQISKHRLMYAYEKIVSADEKQAQKYLDLFRKGCKTHPYAGDLITEQELINLVDDLAGKKI